MAKLAFSKLKLAVDNTKSNITVNDQTIEVRHYLPVEEKLELLTKVIMQAHDPEVNYNNPLRNDVYFTIEVVKAYTNIAFTETQMKDVLKLYDMLVSSGIAGMIWNEVPETERENLENALDLSIEAIYKYRNSVLGILDTVKQDYDNLDMDASVIQQQLADPNNLTLVKDILTKLG